jgi:hypothetical protein
MIDQVDGKGVVGDVQIAAGAMFRQGRCGKENTLPPGLTS